MFETKDGSQSDRYLKMIIKMPYDLNDDLDLKFTDLFSV